MTTTNRLIYMANQIAANLATDEDPARAVAEHMALFWDPRMKKLIFQHGPEGLSPIAAAAIQKLAEAQNAA